MMNCCQLLQSMSIFCSVLLHTQPSKSEKVKKVSVSSNTAVSDCNEEAPKNKQDAKLGLKEKKLFTDLQELDVKYPISKIHTDYKLFSFIKGSA